MRRRLHAILPAALLAAAALPGLAQTQGRISVHVVDKGGKPMAGAKMHLKRTDRNWTKDLVADAKGMFSQAGLDPVNFEVTISVDGYQPYMKIWKVPIGDTLQMEITLLKAGEGGVPQTGVTQTAPSGDGAKEENEGLELFNNQVIPFVNEGKFLEAMGPSEAALGKLKEALEKTKDDAAKAELQPKVNLAERIYGICLFENGKKAEAKTVLEKVFARNEPEAKLDKSKWDTKVLDSLQKIAKEQKDTEGEKKYQSIIDSIIGPRPELAYNEGVAAYNSGKIKEAKSHIQKAIQVKPDFPDSYYMMGLIELNEGNIRGAKQHFQKYLDLAPTGKKAAEIRDMLKAI